MPNAVTLFAQFAQMATADLLFGVAEELSDLMSVAAEDGALEYRRRRPLPPQRTS